MQSTASEILLADLLKFNRKISFVGNENKLTSKAFVERHLKLEDSWIEKHLKLEDGWDRKTFEMGIANCQFKANWIVVHPIVFQLRDVTQSELITI